MSTFKSKSQNLSVEQISRNLNAAGIPPEFGEDNSRLLVKAWRTLAKGQPLTNSDIELISDEVGIAYEKAVGSAGTWLAGLESTGIYDRYGVVQRK